MKPTDLEPSSLECSELGSSRYGPPKCGLCMYASYDLGKDVSKLIRAKRGSPQAVLAICERREATNSFFNEKHLEHAYSQTRQQIHHFRQALVRV
jgi:hypothetical protein